MRVRHRHLVWIPSSAVAFSSCTHLYRRRLASPVLPRARNFSMIQGHALASPGLASLSPKRSEVLSDVQRGFVSDSSGGKSVKNPDYVMPFGKHKGEPLESVPKGYITWMATNGVLSGRSELLGQLIVRGLLTSPPEETKAKETEETTNPVKEIPQRPTESPVFTNALAKNVIFFDLEAVRSTAPIGDLKNSSIVQFGAVDGCRNEIMLDIRPNITWEQVHDTGGFFAKHNFQRFFSEANPLFADAWNDLGDWILGHAEGVQRDDSAPLFLVAHNGGVYDWPLLQHHLDGLVDHKHLAPDVVAEEEEGVVFEGWWDDVSEEPEHCQFCTRVRALGGRLVCLVDSYATLKRAFGRAPAGRWRLQDLYLQATGQSLDGAHDALADAKALHTVYKVDFDNFFQPRLARAMGLIPPIPTSSPTSSPSPSPSPSSSTSTSSSSSSSSPKIRSRDISVDLWNTGLDAATIATERGLLPNTIVSHLVAHFEEENDFEGMKAALPRLGIVVEPTVLQAILSHPGLSATSMRTQYGVTYEHSFTLGRLVRIKRVNLH